MRTKLLSLALGAAVVIAACGGDDDEPTGPGNGDTIQLTAAQATALKDRIVQLAPVHPELAWLADTIRLVVGTGVEAQVVPVTIAGSDGPFYAVSLQRTINTTFSATAAFDVIMFNDPSNPTDFIIASGWIGGGAGNSPTSVSGAVGGTATSTINTHIFHVAGSTVSAWRASTGTASFTRGSMSGSCPSVPNTAAVTCQQADLNVTLDITQALADNPSTSSTRALSLASTDVSGIIIKMQIQ